MWPEYILVYSQELAAGPCRGPDVSIVQYILTPYDIKIYCNIVPPAAS